MGRWLSRLASVGLLLLGACGEPVVEQQVEAGVLDVIDLGFDDAGGEDAGGEDAGGADVVTAPDACRSDGSCG